MSDSETVAAASGGEEGTAQRRWLIVGIVLLAVVVIVSAFAYPGWLSWLFQRSWVVALVILVIAIGIGYLTDRIRPKNTAWTRLRAQFAAEFATVADRTTFGTGRGQVGAHSYFGLRSFATTEGLEICRILSMLNPPLHIPWTAMAKIDAYPNLLSGRKGFESDMQARVFLRDQADLVIEVPWLKEYRQLLPKSVKYRSIQLSKK